MRKRTVWITLCACCIPGTGRRIAAQGAESEPDAFAPGTPNATRAVRWPGNPIITPQMLPGQDGANINGPSVIRVPGWVKNPVGKYYLYFGHHRGTYIRLACSDTVEGPYKVHPGGVLRMADQRVVRGHIASPDVIVDDLNREILLYYHGVVPKGAKGADFEEQKGQATAVAVSKDGIHFEPLNVIVAPAYLRMFTHKGCWYALTGSGRVFRARNLKAPFEDGHDVIDRKAVYALYPRTEGEGSETSKPWSGREAFRLRHAAVDVDGDKLTIYVTCVGHCPERIYRTRCGLGDDWTTWKAEPKMVEVLRPEEPWEGAGCPLQFSHGGPSPGPENALRDPGIFKEGNKTYLLYSVMGEHGLAIARLK